MRTFHKQTPETRAKISARRAERDANGQPIKNTKEREHYKKLAVYWAKRAILAEQKMACFRGDDGMIGGHALR